MEGRQVDFTIHYPCRQSLIILLNRLFFVPFLSSPTPGQKRVAPPPPSLFRMFNILLSEILQERIDWWLAGHLNILLIFQSDKKLYINCLHKHLDSPKKQTDLAKLGLQFLLIALLPHLNEPGKLPASFISTRCLSQH